MKKGLLFFFISLMFLLGSSLPCKYKSELPSTVKKDSIVNTDTLSFIQGGEILDMEIEDTEQAVTDHLVEVALTLTLSTEDSLKLDSLQKVEFKKITKRVNGGYNGWSARLKEWIKFKRILKDSIR